MTLEQAPLTRQHYSNVISIRTGKPVDLPTYHDRRGPTVCFQACTVNGWVDVQAMKVVFGLVMHRSVSSPSSPVPRQRWAISEACSGLRIVAGATRQDTLDSLAMQVAYLGGEAAFLQCIESASNINVVQKVVRVSMNNQRKPDLPGSPCEQG